MDTVSEELLEKTITIPDSDGLTMVIQKIGKRGSRTSGRRVCRKLAMKKVNDLRRHAEMFASLRSMTGKDIKTPDEAEADSGRRPSTRDPVLACDHRDADQAGGEDLAGTDLVVN